LVALPHRRGLYPTGQECRRRGGVGFRQRRIEVLRGIGERFGTLQDGVVFGDAVVEVGDAHRRGDRAAHHDR
jgi:hypothetical protein